MNSLAILLSVLMLSFIFTSIAIVPFIDLLYKLKFQRAKQDTRDAFGALTPIFNAFHQKKAGVPVGGGLLVIGVVSILFAVIIPLIGSFGIQITSNYENIQSEINILFFTFLSFGILGMYDDIKKFFKFKTAGFFGLRMKHKMILEIVLATIISFMLYYNLGISILHIPFVGTFQLGVLYVPFATFVIVAFANAVNITDGLDGLASGTLMISLFGLWFLSSQILDVPLSLFLALLIGSLISFLYFNVFPARIFMGDVGSLAMGASLAVIGLLLGKVIALIVIGFIFVLEISTSLIQLTSKRFLKKKVFPAAPIHLTLQKYGWEEPKIVQRAWLVQIMLTIFGVWLAVLWIEMKKKAATSSTHSLVVAITAGILTALGLLFVFEASTAESFSTFGNQYHYLTQHSIGVGLGLITFLVGFCMPPKFWIKWSPVWYGLGVLLLLLIFIPGIGLNLNGAQRWISIAGLRFQSVEFMKFALIAFFSHWLSKHQRFAPFLFLTGLPILLVILQPDLGSLLLLAAIAAGLYFISGGNMLKLAGLAAAGIPAVIFAIVNSPYRLRRLTTFLNPESDPLGASFHIRQITLALGRGGWIGQGIGGSQQKFAYIPEASSDSIFAIIAEEIGFLGSTGILLLFGIFFYNAYKIANKEKLNKSLRLLAYGIILWIALQVILNISAVVALIPLTGMPLPFISYGRSALVMILFATGILVRIGKES